MNTTARLEIVPLGLSLSAFLVVSYVLCVLYGVIISDTGMHQLLATMLPGFTWLTWTSFLIGLAWSAVVGWYVAVVFAPLFNFFNSRTK